ncbi:hypothetical protein N7G274_004902 [Stereocaulon virgatum]|uniref:D-isomer specific 2-hydroxyacid dehydrogenase catalytic domain-containing protein n=1 Tax=Stereocaulon virgatum TaxID=373712 RepID=A0ABR4A9G6_9LECA
MASKPLSPIHVAVLDDYQNPSAPYMPSHPIPKISTFTKPNEPVKGRNDHHRPRKRSQTPQRHLRLAQAQPLPRELLTNLPNHRLILATGSYNAAIDLEACEENGIIVAGAGSSPSNTSTAPMRDNTAQHTWALILALA